MRDAILDEATGIHAHGAHSYMCVSMRTTDGCIGFFAMVSNKC